MNKKDISTGLCLMLLGFVVYQGSQYIPNTFIRFVYVVGSIWGIFMVGISFIILGVEEKLINQVIEEMKKPIDMEMK